MPSKVILFRNSLETEEEFKTAKKYFDVYENRALIPSGSFVIPRYSCLPFYNELANELDVTGSCLIDSAAGFNFIANFRGYYGALLSAGIPTPISWFDASKIDQLGPYIVKGRTNSRRNQWKTHMFAPTKQDAVNIGCELLHDGLIGSQGIVYRKYVPLEVLDYGVTGMPISNEYRFFFYQDKLIAGDFYWSIIEKPATFEEDFSAASVLAILAATVIKQFCNFFVIDVAKTERGDFTVIECNYGGMSGLSYIDADKFYSNLAKLLK